MAAGRNTPVELMVMTRSEVDDKSAADVHNDHAVLQSGFLSVIHGEVDIPDLVDVDDCPMVELSEYDDFTPDISFQVIVEDD